MKTEIELLQEQFEDFKQSSKEIEDFLEKELQDLTENMIRKDEEIKELKEELHSIKLRYINEGSFIMKLHQDIGSLNKKLEEETKNKNLLEILNESYVEKLRILNFRVSELESELATLQENLVFSKLDSEEKEKLRDREISKLNLVIEDFKLKNSKEKKNFKANGDLNKIIFSGLCRDRLLIGSEIFKYFQEFDEISQTKISENLEHEIQKFDSNKTFIFYGFRRVFRVLCQLFIDEGKWSCYGFYKNSENEIISHFIDSKEIKELSSTKERSKTCHYFHSISFRKYKIQIFDFCENDKNASSLLEQVIQSFQLTNPVFSPLDKVHKTRKIILSLNCVDLESTLEFVDRASSLIRYTKNAQAAGCCGKEFNGTLASYKKKIVSLQKKLNHKSDLFVCKIMIKNKERKGKTEINKLKNSFFQFQGSDKKTKSSNVFGKNRELRNITNAPDCNAENGVCFYRNNKRVSSYKFLSSEVENLQIIG